jgi:hypothetical protein
LCTSRKRPRINNLNITHTHYLPENPSFVHSFAASAATKEELEAAAKRRKLENSKPVKTERRIWRPQVTSQYQEPDCVPDPLGDLEILFKEYGKPLWVNKTPLPPRTDLIKFSKEKHGEELARNLQWKDCPEEFKETIKSNILEFWDVFAEEGVRNTIRGALFHVDTGTATPISVKPPRYGPHETRVIEDLIEKLEKNGIIEDDDGPWGAPIVLAAKANQEHLHWSQYVWRLCVSYRKINAITRPFTFPIMRCDDAVREIGDSKVFITMDLDSGYWRVLCEKSSKPKLAFFTPSGKKRFKTMPMGATNAHPVFVALVAKFKKEWDELARKAGLKGYKSQVIVDDIMISARDTDTLIAYFRCILQILQHYRCTAKLKKCRFLPAVAEFVGLDIHADGNAPAKAKSTAFEQLSKPKTFTDLNMLIGCFGFYQEHLPLYEVRIKRWRQTQKLRPPPGTAKDKERLILDSAWDEEDEKLLRDLKKSILSTPVLRRPDPNLRYYLKTDWSHHAMGAALLQPDDSPQAKAAMADEIKGGLCQFDQTLSGLRLRPIAFISRRTSEPEKSYHSYVGEACAGIWAIEKFRPYLFGREFTWLTDCSGLKKFFEGDDIPTHMIQRWRMQLLRYDFTIVHRPGRMMFECDLLSRYNQETEKWRATENPVKTALLTPIPFTRERIKTTAGGIVKGTRCLQALHKRTDPSDKPFEEEEQAILEAWDTARSIWIMGARMNVINEALSELGVDMIQETAIDNDATWKERVHGISGQEAIEQASRAETAPDWLICTSAETEGANLCEIREIINSLAWKGLSAVILFHNATTSPSSKFVHADWNRWIRDNLNELQWSMTPIWCENGELGGPTDASYRTYVLGNTRMLDPIRNSGHRLPEQSLGPDQKERNPPMREFLKTLRPDEALHPVEERHVPHQKGARSSRAVVSSRVTFETGQTFPVFDDNAAAPDLAGTDHLGPRGAPIVETEGDDGSRIIRDMRWDEASRMLGLDESKITRIHREDWPTQEVWQELGFQPPKATLRAVFAEVIKAEKQHRAIQDHVSGCDPCANEPLAALLQASRVSDQTPVFQTTLDRWTTIPLPTHKKWAEAVQQDRDLATVLRALENEQHLERHRVSNKKYHDAWEKGQLEQEEGLIYHTGEPRITLIRQLRRKVVPKSLRQLIITAYHATPLAGHSGIYRTYWRIVARYWWPRMYLDIKEAVGACAHCKLANAVGQDSQSILDAISCDTPFDIIAIDVWSPGAVSDKYGNTKTLTSLDTMTGFASAAILQSATSDNVARACFATFFVPNGLPKLVLIDAGSENKGELVSMCRTLGIKYHMVAPEQHNGILCERFHRYLNKVQRIGAADSQSYTQWAQGVMFATYSWNAAPIDGTNLIRSFVAKGRVFPFPLQISEEDNPVRIPPGQGEEATAFVETNFPLWAKQSTMLQILVAERRERHRDLANAGRTNRLFNPGDLVVIRKQVQSSAEKGLPAKQTFKWKGIYKVLERTGERSYNVQKLPSLQGRGRPGKILKYSAGVMERIPSSLIVNKHLDTSDTRLATLDQELISNPLEQSLGFHEYGKYVRAAPGSNFAFDRIEDLWSIDIDSDGEDEGDTPSSEVAELPETTLSPQALYESLRESRDKIVIIKSQDPKKTCAEWYAAKVDWEESSQKKAQEEGVYRLIWLVPHQGDSRKRRRRDCRYWPEVHELSKTNELGKMRLISPGKATRECIESQGWAFYEWDTNLMKDLLVGPFDLQMIQNQPNRIPSDIWHSLKVKARQLGVDVSNVDAVSPIC